MGQRFWDKRKRLRSLFRPTKIWLVCYHFSPSFQFGLIPAFFARPKPGTSLGQA
jgi:hypothetical protein